MFHKEGFKIITITAFFTVAAILCADLISPSWLRVFVQISVLIFFILILQFFRNPRRNTQVNDRNIIAPVDGKVVVVQQVFEPEYFKDKRLQVSIFMSPLNVHVTRYPVGGRIKFNRYHQGKYLVAWHPKSSTKNERTTVVIENKSFGEILYRQIAGGLARRIVNYAKEGKMVKQGNDSGFIKFGSRLDLFLPLEVKLEVEVGDRVKGGEQIIATI